jgi:ribosome maturation factor RimP
MAEIKEKVQNLLQPILERSGAFLIDVAVRNERGGKLVQAFIDTDNGITIEECARISRELAQDLDRESAIESAYRLEVSSPGLDKPLHLLRQYRKNIGRRFKILHRREDLPSPLVGTLESLDGDQLIFRVSADQAVTIDFNTIIESREELPW